MYAGEAIDIFSKRLGGSFSRPEMLQLINDAQMEVLALTELPFMRRKGTHFLETTTGVFEYEIDTRYVSRIFTRSGESQTRDSRMEYGRRLPGASSPIYVGQGQSEEYDMLFDMDEALTPDDVCTIYVDPSQDLGDTDDVWIIEMYDWPTVVEAESTKLSMPNQWITTLLYYMVKLSVDQAAYGVDIYSDPKIAKFFDKFLGKQARQTTMTKPQRRMRF